MQAKFDENVLDATNAWSRHIDGGRAELAGLPRRRRRHARAPRRKQPVKTGWLFTLDAPNYQAVLTHAEDRAAAPGVLQGVGHARVRAGRRRGGTTRALMEEILGAAPRGRAARRLRQFRRILARHQDGAATPRRCSSSCAGSRDCAGPRPSASSPNSRRSPAARSKHGTSRFTPSGSSASGWPCPRRSCGPISRCRACSTDCSPSPSGCTASASRRARTSRSTTRTSASTTSSTPTASARGGFFLDLYARPKKRGGAWMDECVGRIALGDASALPVAYLVCNFTPPASRGLRC